jgi:hypothetical protein
VAGVQAEPERKDQQATRERDGSGAGDHKREQRDRRAASRSRRGAGKSPVLLATSVVQSEPWLIWPADDRPFADVPIVPGRSDDFAGGRLARVDLFNGVGPAAPLNPPELDANQPNFKLRRCGRITLNFQAFCCH